MRMPAPAWCRATGRGRPPKDFATWAACRLESNSASIRARADAPPGPQDQRRRAVGPARRPARQDRARGPAGRSRRRRATSGMPVTGVATQGVPSAIASSSTVGSPSRLPSVPTTHGAASTAASRTTEITWPCGSGTEEPDPSPRPSSSRLGASSASRSPAPTRSTRKRSRPRASSAAASIRSSKPFFSTSRPTAAITGARSRRSLAARTRRRSMPL